MLNKEDRKQLKRIFTLFTEIITNPEISEHLKIFLDKVRLAVIHYEVSKSETKK